MGRKSTARGGARRFSGGVGLGPQLLRKLRLDPATSSAPFVATLCDLTGLISYLSVALLLSGTLLQDFRTE